MFDFGLYTQVSELGPHGPLVSVFHYLILRHPLFSVSKKNVYMSDSIKIETPSHIQRLLMTSSPRANVDHDIIIHDERKHKKKRRKRSKKPAGLDDALLTQNGQIPKALTPMPKKLRSMPPEDIHLRPSSALERPREKVNLDYCR